MNEALILTLLIESLLLIILKFKDSKLYLISIIINSITNLSLNYYLTNTIFNSLLVYSIIVIILEILIVFIEALTYMIYFKEFSKAFKISFILNTSSFLIGLIINFFQFVF